MLPTDMQLKNINNWQQQVSPNHTVNGFHRPGHHAVHRLHFLHGTGFCAMTLAAMASQLPTTWDLWLTDVPGHGNSTQPNHRMPDWQLMAKTIAEAISQQANIKEAGPVVGIGHSMGGVLTLLAASQYPHLFSRIILLDPVLFKAELVVAQHLMRATGAWKHSALVRSVSRRRAQWPSADSMINDISSKPFYQHWHAQTIADFVKYATNQDAQGALNLACDPHWEGSIFGSYPRGLWHAVRKVSVPVDILVANKSYRFIPSAVKQAAKVNSFIRWQYFGNNHCFPMEQPLKTAMMIQQLLENKRP